MARKNFGTGVSRTLDMEARSWRHVVAQQGRPALDYELNLMQDIVLDRGRADRQSFIPSGFLSLPPFAFLNDDDPNTFLMPDEHGAVLMAHVNGWVFPVRGTQVGDLEGGTLNNPANLVVMPGAPDPASVSHPMTSRVDLVYLEVWLALVTGNSDNEPVKPPGKSRLSETGEIAQQSQIWPFGNILYGGETIDDDLIDPEINLETTKRVQLQYAVRVWEDIDLASWPRGLGHPDMVGIGPQASPPSYGTPFRNLGDETGDFGLWASDLPDLTVDGRVYAVPICAVHRRNSGGFDANANPNGSYASGDTDLELRPDRFAYDRVVASDIVDLRHKAVLSAASAQPAAERSARDIFAGSLATSFGSDATSADVAGSTVSVHRELVQQPDFSSLRPEHAGFCDGVKRTFSTDAVAEKDVFFAISPEPALQWAEGAINTVVLHLPAESSSRFSERREPRMYLSVTQELISFNSAEVTPGGKSMTLTFGVGPHSEGSHPTGRGLPQHLWLFLDIETPAATGLGADPLTMQAVKVTAIDTGVLDGGRRVATSSLPGADSNATFYGTVYRDPTGRIATSGRRLPAPLSEAAWDDGSGSGAFEGQFDLDAYLATVDPLPLPDDSLTVEMLSRRVDSLVDLDNDLHNIDAGWVAGRRGLFVNPLNATATTSTAPDPLIRLNMSTHAFYVRGGSDPIFLLAGRALYSMISPLPLLHIRGAYLRVSPAGGEQVRDIAPSDYTKAEPSLGEVAGSVNAGYHAYGDFEQCTPENIVDRGNGINTYRLSSSPLMQVLEIAWEDSVGAFVSVYEAGQLKDGSLADGKLVPVYIRENGATDQVAILRRRSTVPGAQYEPFEFSADPTSDDYVGRYRIRYRWLPDAAAVPLDTDYILTNSDYIAAKLGEADPDQAFRDAGVENGHEVFLDADIRVPLPLNSEATVPIVHAPAQVAEMETDEFEIDHVPRQMMLTTASPVRLGDSILPDFAGHATENAFVSQVPVAGGDFEGGAIALPTATVQTRAAVADIQIVGSAGRDPLASLCGRTVRLRASSMTGVFDALLDSGGNPIRVAAESVPVGANGEVAAYIPVTARAATGEIVILLMSQRNQLGFGGAVVDTQAPSFAVTVHRPVGRPLVRASGGVAHSV